MSARPKLLQERDELKARQQLGVVLEAVVESVERLKLKKQLESCEAALNTRRITEKSKEFATVGVSQALAASMDDEFTKLGIGHIKTKLIARAGKGKSKYRLGLALPSAIALDQILSEGEQRAIAIGCFLAELRQANHLGGIVFDDPVSSLDHWRRHKVAERLVEEAKHRQVIVFTHDTVFLMMLADAAKEAGVSPTLQSLECRASLPGYVSPGMPWDHQPYRARIDVLKAKQQAMLATWPGANPSEANTMEMREQYSLLRSTIERVIQDHLLNGVVRRHHDQVQVSKLSKVVSVGTAELAEYLRLYRRCHKVTSAHDPSTGQNVPVPSAAELGQDIAALDAAIAATSKRQKTLS